MKNLLMLLFIAKVTIPMGQSVTYKDVETFFVQDGNYKLVLKDGRNVWVPIMWTVVEEVK